MKSGSRPKHFHFPSVDPSLDVYRTRGAEFNGKVLRDLVDFAAPETFYRFVEMVNSVASINHRECEDRSREQMREITVQQISDLMGVMKLSVEDDDADLINNYCRAKAILTFDLGLATRITVHATLYYDSVRELGSAKHLPFAQRAYRFQDYGCFALTELGHGSNASGIQTRAVYDHASRSFVLHTPDGLAAKFWIGAAGKTANMAVVMAKLVIGGKDYGLHAFLVPIRDYETHQSLEGVILGDCGPKVGLDGVDNGFILFQHYRVPYDALLDKFSQITTEGNFKSAIKNPNKRFATMLTSLIRGRAGVYMGASAALRKGLTVAIRFSAVRKQFGLSDGVEVPILDYQMHRFRLMPHLANFFAVQLASEQFALDLKSARQTFRTDPEHVSKEEIHAMASAGKVLSSMYGMAGLQECREACGGLGYSAFSALGGIRAGLDVATTWEGANHVLIQQSAKFVMKGFQRILGGQTRIFSSLQELTADSAAVTTARLPSEQLRDNPDLLVALAAHKLNHLAHLSAERLRENVGNAKDVVDAWNRTQAHFLYDTGVAYGELVYTKILLRKWKDVQLICPQTASLLLRLTELYLYTKVEKDLVLYRDNDYLSTKHAAAIKDYVVQLCEEVGESSVRIIDAIALPDKLLGSALGWRDGQVYRHFTEAVEGAKDVYAQASWVHLLKRMRAVGNSKL